MRNICKVTRYIMTIELIVCKNLRAWVVFVPLFVKIKKKWGFFSMEAKTFLFSSKPRV